MTMATVRRQREMGHQPVLADLDPLGEAALDHVPAERALCAAEQQDRAEGREQPPRQPPAQPEVQKRHRIGETDQPAPQAVYVLPPVDRLEFGEAHAVIEEAVLRDLLILLELRGPGRGRERRQYAGHRLPLGDRQARHGQPRDAADHDHDKDHAAAQEQPHRDGLRT